MDFLFVLGYVERVAVIAIQFHIIVQQMEKYINI